MHLQCEVCGEGFTADELDDADSTYVKVESWVTGVKLHSPVLRRQTGDRAHKRCIEKLLNGNSPDEQPIPGLEI